MAVEAAKHQSASVRSVYRTFEAIPGFSGTVTFTDVAHSGSLHVVGIDWFSNAMTGVSLGGVYPAVYVEAEEYDPGLVTSLRRADAAPPEAQFNNVVDMLNWLNRD